MQSDSNILNGLTTPRIKKKLPFPPRISLALDEIENNSLSVFGEETPPESEDLEDYPTQPSKIMILVSSYPLETIMVCFALISMSCIWIMCVYLISKIIGIFFPKISKRICVVSFIALLTYLVSLLFTTMIILDEFLRTHFSFLFV